MTSIINTAPTLSVEFALIFKNNSQQRNFGIESIGTELFRNLVHSFGTEDEEEDKEEMLATPL
jgi:hypothetical protein